LLEAVDANLATGAAMGGQIGILRAEFNGEKGIRTMTKTLDAINDALRNPKHSFRKADNHPKKALKHRYERRKIKEYLHLGDWLTEETA
jgi:hypothetical protein